MKKSKRFLALLLTLCMLVSVVPFSVLAEEDGESTSETTAPTEETTAPADETTAPADETTAPADETTAPADETTAPTDETTAPSGDEPAGDEDGMEPVFLDDGDAEVAPVAMTASLADTYRILHLDCGRKYFTKDWIVALINEMAAAGFTHLELAIGNDGLRFLLDDMSVTVGDNTYSSSDVRAAIKAGNVAYYNFGTNELTQSEMNEIIAAAKKAGIGIIPLLNNPGHMDAIVTAINSLTGGSVGYNGSKTTIDLSNETAVAFTKALVQKYINYFAGRGCNEFNMGADEYANDVYSSGSMGFGNLVSNGKYSLFVNYVNEMANMIKTAGMVPMAFNDGFYFNGNTSSGTFDTDIMVSFWTSGWSGYQSASASDLRSRGHEMINTNGDFYYVLGKSDQFDSGYSYASNFSNTQFMGGTVSDPRGSMFCIWCDYPNAETETEIAANTRSIIRAMGARMQGQSIDDLDVTSDVPGGFNADGSINVPEAADVKIETGSGTTSMKVNGTTTLSLSDGSSAVWTSSDESVVSLASAARSTEVTGTSVTATANKAGTATITATVGETAYQMTLTVSEAGVPEKVDDTVTLQVGGIDTRTQADVNNKENVDTNYLDTNIATVVVDGKDAVEASDTYIKASDSCNTLISSNSSNWTAVSGYYYTPDGTNYYPLYAKRSRSFSWNDLTYTYTYTWGYSTTSSTSNVTEIGTQSTTNTSTAPNITVYTKTTTTGEDASTTITFTGVYPGTTYVTVGDVTYKIVVEYKTETLTVILDQTQTVSVSGNVDASALDTTVATVAFSADGKTMTVTGVSVGETTVTVGGTIYTIKVSEEDLSTVDPLSIEYWITNGRPTGSNDETSVSVSAETANSENGIAVTSIAPVNTKKETRTLQYWRCRLLDTTLSNSSTSGTEEQTETSGDDETYNGVEFTRVRYWNGTWAVCTTNNEWVSVTDDHQLVAYYLEILPISDELTVTAADWGKKGDGSTSGDYLDPSASCSVSIQVVYEDGTTNPATTTADDLAPCTIAYGYWSSGRGVGTLNLVGLEGYQIWKVEAETGALTYDTSSSTIWGSFTVDSFTWDGNPMTVYEGDPVDTYTIHNDAHDPSTDGYYQNLMWDENYEAILITVYVKAKPTDDNLTVIYYDEKFGDQLYTYSINVKNGVTFANITPTPSAFADNAERIDVTGCGIENTLGVTQKFQTDLTKVPEAVGKYKSDLYVYTGSVISEDGKTLYLYYNINTEALSPMYVVDFGLPIQFPLSVVVTNVELVKSVSVNSSTRYGTLSYDSASQMFTYTPTKILQNIDVLTINITFDGASSASTTNVGVVPATTVYYEEGFATYTGSWTDTGSKGSRTQTAQVAGRSSDVYGYDAAYASGIGASNGTQATSTAVSDTCTFTFTGTGFEVYANSTTSSGYLSSVVIKNESGEKVKAYLVNTVADDGDSEATSGQSDTLYNLPVISEQSLPFGKYTVTITHIMNSSSIYIDGFRIYGTMETEPAFYTTDKEDSPVFVELRDRVLASLNAVAGDSKDYADQIANNTLSQVYATKGTTAGVVITTRPGTYTNENLTDLLDNGPKNEIFLRNDQALTFTITTAREVQIGLKAPNEETSYTITDTTGGVTTTVKSETIKTSTDMFYKIVDKAAEATHTITITNTGSGILSITKLKVCDDPNAALGSLTAEDLIPAMLSLGFESESGSTEPTEPEQPTEPEEPVVTYADASLTVSLVDYTGKQLA
ncbi:MAG: family 20 glycosylhydrolase, partial [Faecousia sp.]